MNDTEIKNEVTSVEQTLRAEIEKIMAELKATDEKMEQKSYHIFTEVLHLYDRISTLERRWYERIARFVLGLFSWRLQYPIVRK